ncbi:hypothetical protein B0T24DRAFT_683959 [Lasiosphaeria ovina]|uniref:Uncharacterized protein n=1 Tax=Lasiosphaeria ovina TaxID=92902 RepID=A0AAE0JVY8_9PEZI|nr:hypothetical protein B0T24DRAFT_683959 [Lasiosphaeria ovina]
MKDTKAKQAEEAAARIVWAGHALAFLTEKQDAGFDRAEDSDSNATRENEDEERSTFEGAGHGGVVAELDRSSPNSARPYRERFLDSAAQLLSPSDAWGHVVATALREFDDRVEVDVARNDGFTSLPKRPGEIHAVLALCHRLGGFLAGAVLRGEFENEVIAFNSQRVDAWARDLEHALRETAPAPARGNSIRRGSGMASLTPAHRTWIEMRRLLWFPRIATFTPTGLRYHRQQLVRRAYACVSSPAVHALIHTTHPESAEAAWRRLCALARPVYDCGVLQQIAAQRPRFRRVRFQLVMQTQQPQRLRRRYRLAADAACHRLGLAPMPAGWRPRPDFVAACRRPRALHAEMQLVARYYGPPPPYLVVDPQQRSRGRQRHPTLLYFGTSRQPCLLCAGLLCSLPRGEGGRGPIATRPSHGECHPVWGVPAPAAKEVAVALRSLEMVLVGKILACLRENLGDAVRRLFVQPRDGHRLTWRKVGMRGGPSAG